MKRAVSKASALRMNVLSIQAKCRAQSPSGGMPSSGTLRSLPSAARVSTL